MKVPAGTLTSAHYQLASAVGKVVSGLNLMAAHKGRAPEDYPGHPAELLLAVTDETFWRLGQFSWCGAPRGP